MAAVSDSSFLRVKFGNSVSFLQDQLLWPFFLQQKIQSYNGSFVSLCTPTLSPKHFFKFLRQLLIAGFSSVLCYSHSVFFFFFLPS
jgi:hypothetical protein